MNDDILYGIQQFLNEYDASDEWFLKGKHVRRLIVDCRGEIERLTKENDLNKEDAMARAKERGKEIIESYKHMDRHQIVVLIAKYIYNHTEGEDQGCLWWVELDEKQRQHYISVAKFVYDIVIWSQEK